MYVFILLVISHFTSFTSFVLAFYMQLHFFSINAFLMIIALIYFYFFRIHSFVIEFLFHLLFDIMNYLFIVQYSLFR